ncbi:MAG: hypothetical protein ACLPYY_00875 [Acidimicrobiales bacterium]
MPSAHAHMPKGNPGDAVEALLVRDRPIRLADIDQVLGESAGVEHAQADAPIRTWREELTLALESLAYAGAVLSTDVAILRHCLRAGSNDQSVVAELPAVMASQPWGEGWSASCDAPDRLRMDPDVFVRSDLLMSAHQEMAQLDLSAPEQVARLLGLLEEQLSAVAERHGAVEIRLQQIRSAIIGQYQRGPVSTRNRPA